MSVSFPFPPNLQFYDENGNTRVWTNPILHRFLLELWQRTGGPTSHVDFEPIFSELSAKEESHFEEITELQTDLTFPQDLVEVLEAIDELRADAERMRSVKIDNYARRYAMLVS